MDPVTDSLCEVTSDLSLQSSQHARSIATSQHIRLHHIVENPISDPLSSVGLFRAPRSDEPSSTTNSLATRPLVLRGAQPAADHEVSEYMYDPQRQIATDPAGTPLGPRMDKDWTTIEGTHTDGDGGDNEVYDWEEAQSV